MNIAVQVPLAIPPNLSINTVIGIPPRRRPVTHPTIDLAIASRKAQGLVLTWMVPELDGERLFTAYPNSPESKARWLRSGETRGWKLITKEN